MDIEDRIEGSDGDLPEEVLQNMLLLKPWCSRAKLLLKIRAVRAKKRKAAKLLEIRNKGLDEKEWLNSKEGEAWEEQALVDDRREAAELWLGATTEEMKSLKSRFPAITLSSRLGPKDLKFWKKNLCVDGKPIHLADMVEMLLQHDMLETETPHLAVSLVSLGDKGLQIHISSNEALSKESFKGDSKKTVDPNAQPFSCILEFNPGDKGGPNAKLVSVQAKNRGRQVMAKSLLPCMKALNVQQFTLDASGLASSRDGCLAWARYGFVPPQETWDDMRRDGLELIKALGETLGESAKELLDALLDANPASLKRLMALSWKYKSKEKDLLSAQTQFVNSLIPMSWKGSIDLGDPACEKWISSYANLSPGVDYFALLPELGKEPSHPPPKKKDLEIELAKEGSDEEPEGDGKASSPDTQDMDFLPLMLVDWAQGDPESHAEISKDYLEEIDKKYTSEAIAQLLDGAAEKLPAAIQQYKLEVTQQVIEFFASILGDSRTKALLK